jgi:hypothetical protein
MADKVEVQGRNLRDVAAAWFCAGMLILAGCASERPSGQSATRPEDVRALISQSMPRSVHDRSGWTDDIYQGFSELHIEPTHENVCAVVAVIAQESGFRTDPVIPGLGVIARKEIDERARHAGVPHVLVDAALSLKSSNGESYTDRLDRAKTEHDLSDIFEDFTGKVPMGQTLFAGWNPIRTRGPMQVNVAFAKQYADVRSYPYPVKTRYDKYLYRFADFNAGQFSSRNAAFQSAISVASGIPLARDGALLPHDAGAKDAGGTQLALRKLSDKLDLDEAAIHAALEQSRTKELESTPLYERVYALAERRQGHPLPRALIPRIQLHGPKISRNLTTDWYARRVDERFQHCLTP